MTDQELKHLLSLEQPDEIKALFDAAYARKLETIGPKVSLRGLIEISNICRKNCYYCGIRRDNHHVQRYRMSQEEILTDARWIHENGFGSLVLQSGELSTPEFTDEIEFLLREIHAQTGGELGITLSCGEQSADTYERWRKAGATRYLLRIESSTPEFYHRLHPNDTAHDFTARVNCLKLLKTLDYQVGSGVMIGLPGQTVDHLVHDLRFFEELDLDMIGMGPYIPHADTPLGAGMELTPDYRRHQLNLGLKMIAVTRLLLGDVNIASTTALQALEDTGREQGLLAGANVIMPNATDTGYRKSYQLYADKPGLEEGAEDSRTGIERRVRSIGEEILWNQHGDSRHYAARKQAANDGQIQ